MSLRSMRFFILGLAVCAALVAATGVLLPGESGAIPSASNCPSNMDAVTTYHCGPPISEDTMQGAVLRHGCGSNVVESWGSTWYSLRSTSCAPCGQGVLPPEVIGCD